MKMFVGFAVTVASLVVLVSPSGREVRAQAPGGLDQRPLKLPLVRESDACPVSTGTSDTVPRQSHIFGGGTWYGRGPVYFNWTWGHSGGDDDSARFLVGRAPIVNGAHRAKTPWVAAPSFSGPILVRAQALDARRAPIRFSAQGAERLDMKAPNELSPNWSFWPSSFYIAVPGCYGVQIDTSSGTDVVVFEVVL